MDSIVDHVVYADQDIEKLRESFESVGLEPSYGGEHGNGVTHNYLLGFEDGSYFELLSKLDPDGTSPWWDEQINANAGPAAWALYVDDIEAETDRIAELGFAVDGPTHYQRERPDGKLIEWDLAGIGERELGTELPFLISDRTPREYRVNVSEDLAEMSLVGVAEVVVAVPDIDDYIDTYQTLFDCGDPEITRNDAFGAKLAGFEEFPATLASPLSDESWVADRLDAFGPLPCCYLLGTTDLAKTAQHIRCSEQKTWFGDDLRWLDLPLAGRVGIVNRTVA